MDKEAEALKKRLIDLGNQSYRNNIFTFSGFLSLAEQQIVYEVKKEMGNMTVKLFGGVEESERKMVRFGDCEELGYEEEFPIVCIHIQPLLKKFSEQLTHRDFLGAIMNLGIERSTIGDINVCENECYLFCLNKIADFISKELCKIKHTNIKCERLDSFQNIVKKEPKPYEILVSSKRVDGIISHSYHLSRTQSIELFRRKKVFVNGFLQENNSYVLKEGDIITVRGYGKFIYERELSVTRKEKYRLLIRKYED